MFQPVGSFCFLMFQLVWVTCLSGGGFKTWCAFLLKFSPPKNGGDKMKAIFDVRRFFLEFGAWGNNASLVLNGPLPRYRVICLSFFIHYPLHVGHTLFSKTGRAYCNLQDSFQHYSFFHLLILWVLMANLTIFSYLDSVVTGGFIVLLYVGPINNSFWRAP